MEISIFQIQHEAKIIQHPFQNRLGNRSRNWFVGFRCFGTMFLSFCIDLHASIFMFLSCACIFLSFCIHFLSCSFHFPSFSFHLYSCPFMFLSYSFHFHSNVHAFPFIFLPSACMFLSFCINFLSFPSCPFISFLKLWNSLVYGLARGPSATNGYR